MKTSFLNLALLTILVASVSLMGTTSSMSTYEPLQNGPEYDPWLDYDDDGDIDLYDAVKLLARYGAKGTPINKTALLLELEARIDDLNASIISLKECIVVTSSKPYNSPTAYTSGTGFVINVSDSIPSGFTLVSAFATGRKTDLGGTTLDEPPLNLLPRVSGTNIEIRVWDAGGSEYDNWPGTRAHIDYTLFITK